MVFTSVFEGRYTRRVRSNTDILGGELARTLRYILVRSSTTIDDSKCTTFPHDCCVSNGQVLNVLSLRSFVIRYWFFRTLSAQFIGLKRISSYCKANRLLSDGSSKSLARWSAVIGSKKVSKFRRLVYSVIRWTPFLKLIQWLREKGGQKQKKPFLNWTWFYFVCHKL